MISGVFSQPPVNKYTLVLHVFRVALQYEFTKLHLDDVLERQAWLRHEDARVMRDAMKTAYDMGLAVARHEEALRMPLLFTKSDVEELLEPGSLPQCQQQ